MEYNKPYCGVLSTWFLLSCSQKKVICKLRGLELPVAGKAHSPRNTVEVDVSACHSPLPRA